MGSLREWEESVIYPFHRRSLTPSIDACFAWRRGPRDGRRKWVGRWLGGKLWVRKPKRTRSVEGTCRRGKGILRMPASLFWGRHRCGVHEAVGEHVGVWVWVGGADVERCMVYSPKCYTQIKGSLCVRLDLLKCKRVLLGRENIPKDCSGFWSTPKAKVVHGR